MRKRKSGVEKHVHKKFKDTNGIKYVISHWKVCRTNAGFFLEAMYIPKDMAESMEASDTEDVSQAITSSAIVRSLIHGRSFINVKELPFALLENYSMLLAAPEGTTIAGVGSRPSEDVFYVIERPEAPPAMEELNKMNPNIVPYVDISFYNRLSADEMRNVVLANSIVYKRMSLYELIRKDVEDYGLGVILYCLLVIIGVSVAVASVIITAMMYMTQ